MNHVFVPVITLHIFEESKNSTKCAYFVKMCNFRTQNKHYFWNKQPKMSHKQALDLAYCTYRMQTSVIWEWFLAWQCILGLCTYSSSTHKYKGRVKHTHPTFPPGQMCLGCIYWVELAHKQTHKCRFPFNPEKVQTSKCLDVKTAESLEIRCSMNVKQSSLRDAAWNTKEQMFFQWTLQVSSTEGFVAWRQELRFCSVCI